MLQCDFCPMWRPYCFVVCFAGTEGTATSYEVKQLEQQNDRLKEALVK